MSEPIVQESSSKLVQESKKSKKGRTLEEKMGRVKWTGVLLNRALDEIQQLRKDIAASNRAIREDLKDVKVKQNVILKGFKGYGLLKYTPPMLQRIACVDAVDLAILESVWRAASPGILPKIIAVDIDVDAELNKRSLYGLKYYAVSRRIVRMNSRLFEELAECLFEKRGLKWAFTAFAVEVWGETDEQR